MSALNIKYGETGSSPIDTGVGIFDENGNEVGRVEYGHNGIHGTNEKVYKNKDGDYTLNPADASKFSIDIDTGVIKLEAPKEMRELPEFDQIFDSDTLKSYSAAYQSDHSYRVPYIQRNSDGTTEEVQITIPEFVDKLNEALGSFVENYKIAEKNREYLIKKYGDKANNLSLTNLSAIASSGADSQLIPLPDFIFQFDNDFNVLKDKRDENGYVTAEDFMEVYNRSKVDQADLAAIMAAIDGQANNSDWGEDEKTFEDGSTMKNTGSASEISKALALKNFILSKDPDSEWYQKVGDGIVTAAAGAGDGFTSVIMNTLGAIEYGVTFGHSSKLLDINEEKQETFSNWAEERTLIQDSTAVIYNLSEIGGKLAGTAFEAWLLNGIGEAASGAVASWQAEAEAAISAIGPSANFALTAETYAEAIKGLQNISLGAQFIIKTAPIAEKMSWATGIYQAYKGFMETHEVVDFLTSFVIDTFHDAIVYDATTLRHVIESSNDQNMKDYWLSQFADNSKWWIGMGVARGAFEVAGKTGLGEMLNAKATQKIQGLSVKIGDKKQEFKDFVYGGDIVDSLEKQIDELPDGPKRNHLVNKLNQEKWNQELRNARRSLAAMDLETEGLKLTDESAEAYRKASSAIKRIENVIDRYGQDLSFKRQEMIGLTVDPATGNKIFVNSDLGGANVRAGRMFDKLAKMTERYNLKDIDKMGISQDIVDYIMGSYELEIKTNIWKANGPDSLKAKDDVEVVSSNLKAIEEKLPDQLIIDIKTSGAVETYTEFYSQLNDYTEYKKLVDIETLKSYQNNPIWENGYMPIVKIDDSPRLTTDSEFYSARLEEDIEHFRYGTKEGQHYQNPELTRQYRINDVAATEVNQEMRKALEDVQDATSIIRISGEQSQRVRNYEQNKQALKKAIGDSGAGFSETSLIGAEKMKKKGKIKDVTVDLADRTEAISSFSPEDTSQILYDRKVLFKNSPTLSGRVNAENYLEWYNVQTEPVREYLKQIYGRYTDDLDNIDDGYSLFRRALEDGGDDFEAGLQRAYLIGDTGFAKSPELNQAMRNIEDGKDALFDGYAVTKAKAKLKNVNGINTDEFVDDIQSNLKESVNNYIDNVLESEGAKKAIDAIANDSGNGSELAGKYIALQQLVKNKKVKEGFLEKVYEGIKGKVKLDSDRIKVEKQASNMYDAYLQSELSIARDALKTTNSSLVDSIDIYKEVKALAGEINEAEKATRVEGGDTIMYLDDQGRRVYAKVDPNYASLYNLRYKMSNTEASAFAKANAAMSKLFRYGTTTLNFSSFSNQLFRDTGNALFVGGAWSTIRKNAQNLVDVFGDDIVNQIKRFDPSGYEMRQIEAIAEQTGQTIQEAAVSRELARGAAISPATTETTLYKETMKMANKKSSLKMIDGAKTQIDNVLDKFGRVDDLMNGKREIYLRNRVFANNLSDAIKKGYTLEDARTYATFAMNNATTNFTRQLYHMQAIGDSTPYFKAAINGTKSFWRMWALDPVGISGRIMGGLILPTIFLTGASLGDPDNKEVYEKLPEYQKKDNLIFVIDKQVVSIPIPQEISNITTPFRQFVEYLHGANENDFWELMMNDVLGFSPVDLTGFSTIDMDKLIQDPTIKDRISRGFAKVFSQVAPVPVKSAYMMITGTDPYTGKKLNDPSYCYWDDSTNSVQTMDYNQNAFAKWVAKLWGKDANAKLIEKVVSGVVGSTGSNALGELVTLLEQGPEAAGKQVGSDIFSQVTKPYTVEVYDQIDSIWKRAVQELTAEKNKLTSSDDFKAIYSELAQTKDEEKRKKLMASGQNLVKDYQNKVIETAKRLESVYHGTFDRKKFGAVIQLLNFNSDALYQNGTQYSSDIAQDIFYEGKNTAVSTMEALGVTGTNDLSIFGYLVTDDEGKSVMKYTEPTAIMDMRNAWLGAGDVDQANLEAKLKTDGVKTSDKWNGYYAAKARGSKALKQYKSEWNAKVVKSLAPYISERGVESVIKNSATRDLLENYLFVDNPYQVKSYLKKIFENE